MKLNRKLFKPRIWELDYIRGCLLIFVTLDHCFGFLPRFLHPTNPVGEFFVSLSYLYLALPVRPYLQPLFIFMFSMLSGVNSNLTRNHLQRAAAFGLFVSTFLLLHKIGTLIFPSFLYGLTMFNILSILVICAFIWYFLQKIKAPDIAIAVLAILSIGIGLWFWIYLLKTGRYFELPNGLRGFAFLIYSRQGLDWSPNNFEPLLPSMGFFLAGGLLGKKLYKNKRSLIRHAPCALAKPVIFLGRYSLYAYLFAPVVIIAFFMLLNALRVL